MNSKQKKGVGWLKSFSPLLLGIGILIETQLPASANPYYIPLPSNSYHTNPSGFQSTSPIPPLNVTPPPGTHISLPASNSYYYSDDYYSNCDEYGRPITRVYERNIDHRTFTRPSVIDSHISGSVFINPVIINSPVREKPTHRSGSVVRINY
jgi:hypothetical protein